MWQYNKCPECGKMILSKDDNITCNCVKIRNHRNPQFGMSDPDSLFVEYDPLPFYDGGFRKGTSITQIQVECMCQVGTFSEGTILKDKNNNRFQVHASFDGKQQLMHL